jgi:hypothetical protein
MIALREYLWHVAYRRWLRAGHCATVPSECIMKWEKEKCISELR